jgi:O-antigen/teichoic acid export membrane protein
LYSAPFRIMEGLFMIPILFTASFYPRLSHLYESNPSKHRELAMRSVKYLLVLGGCFALGGALYPQEVLRLVFGEEYVQAHRAFTLLMLGSMLLFANSSLFTTLRSSSGDRAILWLTLVALAVKAFAALLLIPSHGLLGAAAATLASAVAVLSLSALAVHWRGHRISSMLLAAAKVAAALAAVVTLGNHVSALLWPVEAALATILYFLLLLGTGLFDRHELRLVAHVARKLAGIPWKGRRATPSPP